VLAPYIQQVPLSGADLEFLVAATDITALARISLQHCPKTGMPSP